jgi:hypothetical protein
MGDIGDNGFAYPLSPPTNRRDSDAPVMVVRVTPPMQGLFHDLGEYRGGNQATGSMFV